MYTEPAGIVVQAEVYLPKTAAEAMAYYSIRKATTMAEFINLGNLVIEEFGKIHAIMDEAFERCQAAKDAEEQNGRLAESGL